MLLWLGFLESCAISIRYPDYALFDHGHNSHLQPWVPQDSIEVKLSYTRVPSQMKIGLMWEDHSCALA